MMNNFISWLNNSLTPKVNKISKNIWIQSIQNAIMLSLPMIFVGSLISVVSLLRNFIPQLPDLNPINQFSFGLFSLFVAFLLPYQIMEKKKLDKKKILAGFSSLCLFMMLIRPEFTDAGAIVDFSRFGAAGMLVALFSGVVSAVIMSASAKFSLFGKNSPIPDFVQQWFDNMIPISIILIVGYILIYALNFDFFAMIFTLFNPIVEIAQTLPGFVLVCFLPVLLYSFGISSWIITPITFTICLGAIAANAEAVAAGLPATNITTFEVIYCGWVFIGGQGGTLPLVLMMAKSKSERLKAVGKATLIPSIFNINEPVIFGAPIAWNFTLIIPFLLNSLIIPIIVYCVLSAGLVTIPTQLFTLYQMPLPIATWLVCPEIQGLILFAVVVVINSFIWFPFFKAYENQCLKEEAEEADDLDLSLDL